MPLLLFCRCHRKKKSRSNSPPPPPSSRPSSPPPCPPDDDPVALVCHTCKLSIRHSELHINIQQQHPPKQYHIGCFVCVHCHAPINPQSEEFYFSKLSYMKRATTRMGGAMHSRGREQVKVTKTDNEADINSGNTTPRSRPDIIYPEDEEEHAFHRECFAHHFGWLCVVCEKPLPITVTSKPVDSSNDTTPSPTSTYGATRAGRSDTTSIPSSNRNTFHNSNNSARDVTVSNQNLKWRRTAKVEFLKHPFWSNERICPHHFEAVAASDTVMLQQQPQQHCVELDHVYYSRDGEGDDNLKIIRSSSADTSAAVEVGVRKTIRRCTSCHRFEPSLASPGKHFVNFGNQESGHCLCLACCRTVATSTDDVIPLWDRVIDFFEGPLGLITSEDSGTTINATGRRIKTGVTRQDLKNIPILMVGMEALNDNMRELRNDHFGSKQIMTRGLCLSEHHGTVAKQDMTDSVEVSAILCLSGLPSDLVSSILAHEATHAYIKLHPNFSHTNPLPIKVEEGLAQLISHLFLSDGLDLITHAYQQQKSQLSTSSTTATTACSTTSTTTTRDGFDDHSNNAINEEEDNNDIDDGGGIGDDSIPSDDQLRQYFRFCIETDDGVYGEGFRLAAHAYAKMGLQELLYYVALHHYFPPS